jgi:YVTN family beta-propeller protein
MVLHRGGDCGVNLWQALPALTVAALLAACGGSQSHGVKRSRPQPRTESRPPVTIASAGPYTPPARPAQPQALVTAETENRLLVVALPSGRVVRRIALAPDPEDVASSGGVVTVTSGQAGKVTVLEGEPPRPAEVIGGFGAPHIVAIAPDGQHAYVTDDTRGTVTAIDLANLRVTSRIEVGASAHHLSFDAQLNRAWVALGESASTIVILDTSDLARPAVIGRFAPGFPAHDVEFTPSGSQAWVTSSNGPDVSVFRPSDHHLLFRVPVGAPPQHVAFAGPYAYLTSGYGSTIERVDAATGRVLERAASPYGSFELAAGEGYVVTSSLLRGTLAIYTPELKLLRVARLAPATREVAISSSG